MRCGPRTEWRVARPACSGAADGGGPELPLSCGIINECLMCAWRCSRAGMFWHHTNVHFRQDTRAHLQCQQGHRRRSNAAQLFLIVGVELRAAIETPLTHVQHNFSPLEVLIDCLCLNCAQMCLATVAIQRVREDVTGSPYTSTNGRTEILHEVVWVV